MASEVNLVVPAYGERGTYTRSRLISAVRGGTVGVGSAYACLSLCARAGLPTDGRTTARIVQTPAGMVGGDVECGGGLVASGIVTAGVRFGLYNEVPIED